MYCHLFYGSQCTYIHTYIHTSDKVIATIKWCRFFASKCIIIQKKVEEVEGEEEEEKKKKTKKKKISKDNVKIFEYLTSLIPCYSKFTDLSLSKLRYASRAW